jgi:hypothetical protein
MLSCGKSRMTKKTKRKMRATAKMIDDDDEENDEGYSE